MPPCCPSPWDPLPNIPEWLAPSFHLDLYENSSFSVRPSWTLLISELLFLHSTSNHSPSYMSHYPLSCLLKNGISLIEGTLFSFLMCLLHLEWRRPANRKCLIFLDYFLTGRLNELIYIKCLDINVQYRFVIILATVTLWHMWGPFLGAHCGDLLIQWCLS